MLIVCIILAIASMIYGTLLSVQTSVWTSQNWIWFVIALIFVICAAVIALYKKNPEKIPLALVVSLHTIWIVALLVFVVTEIVVMTAAAIPEKDNLDYIVVLGAGIKPDRQPGQSLKARLDKAISYMEDNPRTVAVLSGGQGYDEPCPEAQAMADYMTSRGIPTDRLLLELQSTDTRENIVFSKALIDAQRDKGNPSLAATPGPAIVAEKKPVAIGIVTNDFHIFRALSVAHKLDIDNISGVSAHTPAWLTVHLHVREFMAIMKDKLWGDI